MKQKLIVNAELFIPSGIELVVNLKNNPKFYPEDIRLEKFKDRGDIRKREGVAGIGHLQALLENSSKIPKDFVHHANLAPGSIFKREEKLFIPALIHEAFLDIVALSNRDLEWKIILIELSAPISDHERVIVIK